MSSVDFLNAWTASLNCFFNQGFDCEFVICCKFSDIGRVGVGVALVEFEVIS